MESIITITNILTYINFVVWNLGIIYKSSTTENSINPRRHVSDGQDRLVMCM